MRDLCDSINSVTYRPNMSWIIWIHDDDDYKCDMKFSKMKALILLACWYDRKKIQTTTHALNVSVPIYTSHSIIPCFFMICDIEYLIESEKVELDIVQRIRFVYGFVSSVCVKDPVHLYRFYFFRFRFGSVRVKNSHLIW